MAPNPTVEHADEDALFAEVLNDPKKLDELLAQVEVNTETDSPSPDTESADGSEPSSTKPKDSPLATENEDLKKQVAQLKEANARAVRTADWAHRNFSRMGNKLHELEQRVDEEEDDEAPEPRKSRGFDVDRGEMAQAESDYFFALHPDELDREQQLTKMLESVGSDPEVARRFVKKEDGSLDGVRTLENLALLLDKRITVKVREKAAKVSEKVAKVQQSAIAAASPVRDFGALGSDEPEFNEADLMDDPQKGALKLYQALAKAGAIDRQSPPTLKRLRRGY